MTISYILFCYRLGWLIRFISHSVISGFTTASAIVIGLSQIKYFLGYNVTRSSKIIPLIESIIAGADQVGFLVSPWFYFLLIPHLILFLTVLLVFFLPFHFAPYLALHWIVHTKSCLGRELISDSGEIMHKTESCCNSRQRLQHIGHQPYLSLTDL